MNACSSKRTSKAKLFAACKKARKDFCPAINAIEYVSDHSDENFDVANEEEHDASPHEEGN